MEDVEKCRLRIDDAFLFLEFLQLIPTLKADQVVIVIDHPRHLFGIVEVPAKGLAQRAGHSLRIIGYLVMEFRDDAIDPVLTGVKIVKAKMEADEREDE